MAFIRAEQLRGKNVPKNLVLDELVPLVSLTCVLFSSIEICCHLYQ